MSSHGSEESSEDENSGLDADWTPDESMLSGAGGNRHREGPTRSGGGLTVRFWNTRRGGGVILVGQEAGAGDRASKKDSTGSR